jgi:hypothetical protein
MGAYKTGGCGHSFGTLSSAELVPCGSASIASTTAYVRPSRRILLFLINFSQKGLEDHAIQTRKEVLFGLDGAIGLSPSFLLS